MTSLNYSELGVTTARFSASLDGSLAQSIEELIPADEDGEFEFLQQFSVFRRKQHWYAIVTKEGSKSDRLSVRVTCGRGPLESTTPLPPVTDLLRLLAQKTPGQVEMECNIRFSFKRSRRLHTIVMLPMRVSNHPRAAFSELRGIHVHREGAEIPVVDAVIDTDEEDDLWESLYFVHPLAFSPTTPDDVITLALKLNEPFIWLEPSNAAKKYKQ